MANRMEIELTSARDDESYTWRAAGARQPRGVVHRSLLPAGCKVGDVFRVEVEVEIDGISVVSVLPSKERAPESNKIEYIGPSRPPGGVTTTLAGRPGRGRPSERGGERPPRRRDSDRAGAGERRRPAREEPKTGERSRDRPRRHETNRAEEGTGAPAPERERGARRRADTAGERQGRPRRGPHRFEPGTVHLDELLASLTPEQRPIAERLSVGGLPAVRRALTEEQQRARAEGRPAASGDPIIAIAEELLPAVKAAVWLDRAEAAAEKPDEISLRDLRATVVGAAPRDETGRELERRLREALDKRVSKLREDWEQHLTQALSDGRVLQALRLSARPPEPSARFPAALVPKLAEQSGQAMTEETSVERWLALLEAAVQSPVRRQIRPAGMPKDPNGEVERQARVAASRIPALARLLGMAIPPPPQPAPGERPPRPPVRHGRRPPAHPTGRPGQERPPRAGEPAVAGAAPAADPSPDSGSAPVVAATADPPEEREGSRGPSEEESTSQSETAIETAEVNRRPDDSSIETAQAEESAQAGRGDSAEQSDAAPEHRTPPLEQVQDEHGSVESENDATDDAPTTMEGSLADASDTAAEDRRNGADPGGERSENAVADEEVAQTLDEV